MTDDLSLAYLNGSAKHADVGDGDGGDQLVCDHCGWGDLVYDVGSTELVCPECGLVAGYYAFHAGVGTRPRTSPYQCIFYLHERIKQLEIGEAAIPDDDFERIRMAVAEQGGATDKPSIQRALRSLRGHFSKRYLERWLQIRRRLGGSRPREFVSDERIRLDHLFRAYETTYKLYVRPPNRKHLLHYNYVLRQLCRLIGRADLEEYFPLLKTRDKLVWTEAQWRRVCELNYWTFYSQLTETSCLFRPAFRSERGRYSGQHRRLDPSKQRTRLPAQVGLGCKKAQDHHTRIKWPVLPGELVDDSTRSHRAEHPHSPPPGPPPQWLPG